MLSLGVQGAFDVIKVTIFGVGLNVVTLNRVRDLIHRQLLLRLQTIQLIYHLSFFHIWGVALNLRRILCIDNLYLGHNVFLLRLKYVQIVQNVSFGQVFRVIVHLLLYFEHFVGLGV